MQKTIVVLSITLQVQTLVLSVPDQPSIRTASSMCQATPWSDAQLLTFLALCDNLAPSDFGKRIITRQSLHRNAADSDHFMQSRSVNSQQLHLINDRPAAFHL